MGRITNTQLFVLFAALTLGILFGELETTLAQNSGQSSVTAIVTQTQQINPTCPPPTVQKAGLCVLQNDVTLNATLEVASNTHLNCQGHTITPFAVGTGTGASERSQPEVAILLKEAYGVKIQNCNIVGFDFGIFALKSKIPVEYRNDPAMLAQLQTKILGNTINALFVPISAMSVDNTQVAGNTITYNRNGGVGIMVERDSDMNQITDNTITGNLSIEGAVRVPGSPTTGTGSNPVFNKNSAGAAIIIAQVLGSDPTLFNAVIGNTLYQLNVTDNPAPNEDFSADNIVEANTINFSGGTNDGIVLALPQRTTVRNNSITGSINAMRAGSQTWPAPLPAQPRLFPGACSANAGRLCLENSDCNIPGIDTGSGQGTCTSPAAQVLNFAWFTDHTTMENNEILPPFNFGITLAGKNTLVEGNTMTGPKGTGLSPTGTGIRLLGKFGVETTVILENEIANVANALNFEKTFPGLDATVFGAQVSQNSFTGYTAAVRTSDDYTLSSELSVGQCSLDAATACTSDTDCSAIGQGTCTNFQGNYWGQPCPASDNPLYPAGVLFVNGNINPNVVDSHPFRNSALKALCH